MNATLKLMLAAIVSVAMMMTATIGLDNSAPAEEQGLRSFPNELELRAFLTRERPDTAGFDFRAPSFAGTDDALSERSGSFSSTNIQVSGVDEDDTVKSDGEYIYATSSANVSIIRAYPPDKLEIVSVVEVGDTIPGQGQSHRIQGIFVDSDKLVVVINAYSLYYFSEREIASDYEPPRTVVALFDISDRTNPVMTQSTAVSGYYVSSRMVGGCVYLLSQAGIWSSDEVLMPSLWVDGVRSEAKAADIRYDPETTQANSFLNIMAVDIESGEHELLSIVAGWASVVYMSPDALYFTIQKYQGGIEWEDGIGAPTESWTARTTVYKVDVDGLLMSASASGDVPGWLLNQFSMDDNGSHFRIATTTSWRNPESAVYVLDSELKVVGKLEGLAPGESIYSSRFIRDSLYLVTFRQIDPLFVIDLSDPARPELMGELEMPGFSSYLHPVDEDHILGIGMENGTLKLSLYNVSDPAKPTEQSRYIAGSGWYSQALYDHKAVLFDLERELLVIPGFGYTYGIDGYEQKAGALVFTVSVANGISLRGIVDHASNRSYWEQGISRSLYIEDFLYTIGYRSIQVNQLDDLSFVDSVVYNEFTETYWYAVW